MAVPPPIRAVTSRPLGGPAAPAARLFVALWPSAEAVDHLTEHLTEHRPDGEQLRWQPPERWHLTVAFLGSRNPPPVQRRLAGLRLPPARPLRVTGSGTFGPVLWLGVADDGWLGDLARIVRRTLGLPGVPYRPHLTVARVRGRVGPTDLARTAAAQLADYGGPAWTPDALTLVASVTGPAPRYEVLLAYPFPPAH